MAGSARNTIIGDLAFFRPRGGVIFRWLKFSRILCFSWWGPYMDSQEIGSSRNLDKNCLCRYGPMVHIRGSFPSVISAGFFGWGGSTKCLRGSDFSRVERHFTIGQSPKIWGRFEKMALKLIKIYKTIGKIREKYMFFGKFIIFSGQE